MWSLIPETVFLGVERAGLDGRGGDRRATLREGGTWLFPGHKDLSERAGQALKQPPNLTPVTGCGHRPAAVSAFTLTGLPGSGETSHRSGTFSLI